MIDLLTSPWIPAAVLVFAALGARVVSKSWLAPSAFVLGLWSVYVVVPLAVAPEYKVSGLAVWTIVALAGAVAVGAALGEGPSRSTSEQAAKALPINRMLWASLVFTGLALCGAVYFAVQEINAHGLDLSATGLFLVGRLVALDRYDLGEQQPLLVRLLILWVYPAAILGGMSYFFSENWRRRVLCLGWLAPALLYSVLNAARANTLIAVILALSGYASVRTANRRALQTNLRPIVLLTVTSLVVAVSFFFAVDAVRGNREGAEIVNPIEWPRFKATVFGYLPVFSHWIDNVEDLSLNPPAMGVYTFAGVFEAAGIRHREVGEYTEFVMVDSEQHNNLYTAFRGLVQDFSLPGAIIFLLLTGFASGYAHRECVLGRQIWAPSLAIFYAFVAWSPVISVLIYNGPIIAVIAASMVLVTKRLNSSERRFKLSHIS